jgi:hypothetical protein
MARTRGVRSVSALEARHVNGQGLCWNGNAPIKKRIPFSLVSSRYFQLQASPWVLGASPLPTGRDKTRQDISDERLVCRCRGRDETHEWGGIRRVKRIICWVEKRDGFDADGAEMQAH